MDKWHKYYIPVYANVALAVAAVCCGHWLIGLLAFVALTALVVLVLYVKEALPALEAEEHRTKF